MMENILKNFKGLLYAFILFVLLTLLMSVIMKLTVAPERWSLYYMVAILAICCFFLGVYIGNHIKKRGFVYGAFYSIIFTLILSIIYTLAFSSGIDFGAGLLKFLIPVLFGSIGGMIGVNLQS
ncbi:MAG: TIGR04086 family membrane protein [Eubacteriales bacterium]|nr:TIGR04086 family membrane protein [Eubacteriales bacterium]